MSSQTWIHPLWWAPWEIKEQPRVPTLCCNTFCKTSQILPKNILHHYEDDTIDIWVAVLLIGVGVEHTSKDFMLDTLEHPCNLFCLTRPTSALTCDCPCLSYCIIVISAVNSNFLKKICTLLRLIVVWYDFSQNIFFDCSSSFCFFWTIQLTVTQKNSMS